MDIAYDLVKQIRDGDMTAYRAFVERNWDQAVRACWIILAHQHDAEEAAQDAFVSLYEKRAQLREGEKFEAWFFRILMNSAKQTRRRRRPPAVPYEDVLDGVGTTGLGATDLRVSLQQAMAKLSEAERTALVLSYYCDFTNKEAAAVTGWHLGTYKWRLAKAKRNMTEILEQEDWSSDSSTGEVFL